MRAAPNDDDQMNDWASPFRACSLAFLLSFLFYSFSLLLFFSFTLLLFFVK